MGSLYKDRCYASSEEALDAVYSGVAPAQAAGVPSYSLAYTKGVNGWRSELWTQSGSGAWTLSSSQEARSLSFPECDPSQGFNDGLALGWGIVGVLVVGWAFRLVREQMR